MSDNAIVDTYNLPDTDIIRFANGLRLIIREDHRTPVATCNVWVRVGSNREHEGVRGWSHGIEHMLFKGTTRRGEGDFALEVADIGGSTNAGTGYETTNYHITAPAGNVAQTIDLLHDALFHSTFRAESLDPERDVLVHENHMYDDQPSGFGVSWRWGLEMAFDSSPYRHPIGGLDEALLKTSRQAIMDYYHQAYSPENMTVVVAGAVDGEMIKALIGETFAAESSGASAELTTPDPEPRHDAPRLRIETGDLNQAYAKIIFPTCAENDPDRPAMSIIQLMLSDGRSSRLYRRIQEDLQLVSSITILSETGPREGVLIVDFETDMERLLPATAAICEVLADLAVTSAPESELSRAKIRAERSHILGQETVQGQATNLGWHDSMDDLDGAFTHTERIAAVTAQDVQRVASRLFDRNNASLMYYLPQDEAGGSPERSLCLEALSSLAVHDEARDRPQTPHKPLKADTIPTTRNSGPAQDSPFEETILDNGLRVYFRRDRSLPIFCLGVHAAGGVCHQGTQSGLAYLTQQVQIKGTAGLDAERLHDFIESRGASLSPFVTRDHTGIYLTGLPRHADALLDILGRLCHTPSLPEDELDRERNYALDDLRAMADDPFQLASRNLREMMYPDHPYGSPLIGNESRLPGIDRAGIVDFHRKIWTTRNVHIVASGDLQQEEFLDQLERSFQDLPQADAPLLADLSLRSNSDQPQLKRISRDLSQSIVLQAWRVPANPNLDRAGLAILQKLMNGQSGRLFDRLRNKRSLCYATGVQVIRGFGPGLVVGYVMTSPESEAEAREALQTELLAISRETASREEFTRARQQLVGNMLISLQSNASRVSRCATDVLYGRTPNNMEYYLDEISRMTPEAVREIAGRYLGPDNRFEMIVGPDPS